MDCEKCGAELTGDATVCPECGEPVAAQPVEAVEPEARPARDIQPAAGGRRIGVIIAIALVLVAVVGGAWWLISSRVAAANSPQATAKAMLDAYADYDAKGILDSATHASLAASDVAQFEKQAADAKSRAKGLASIRNIVIGKVTAEGDSKATVEITAEWLDPGTGKYTKRTEKLVLVKQDGKWLVQLF